MAQDNLSKDVEVLRKDIGKLREDSSQWTHSIRERRKNEAGMAKDRISSELMAEFQSAKKRGLNAAHSVEGQITEKPLMSILIAFLVGLILGKLFDKG